MSNNQEHTNTDNMENQTQQALEKDSAQYANEGNGCGKCSRKGFSREEAGQHGAGSDEKRIRELAEYLRSGCGGLCTVRFFSGTFSTVTGGAAWMS